MDAQALTGMPTHVMDPFSFMSPNQYSLGIYAPMLLTMVALIPHTEMFGTFTKIINILQRIKFAQRHVSYLDILGHWHNDQQPLNVNCRVPTPFSLFANQSGYCGVELLSSLLRGALRMSIQTHERYMQAAFQLGVNEGCLTDDSHKLTKHIYIYPGKDKAKVVPFAVTYTALGLNGKPIISLSKFMKSTDELKEVLPTWSKVWSNAGQK